ncbi:MAG TPA: porin [Planctomycetota bacterium]|jgi:phosphate-selective porin OprO/OprP|nr:porin [Planctomycetota bacterium]
MKPRVLLPVSLVFGLVVPAAFSQEPVPATTFEERLVQILKERGLVDEAAKKELLDLALRMRAAEATKKGDLDKEIRTLAAAFETTGQDQTPSLKISYKKGFLLETPEGDFSLRLGAKTQMRATYVDSDEDGPAGDSLSIAVNRLRLEFEGNAYGKELTYKFVPELRGGSVSLRDGYLNYAFDRELQIRAGQYKVPFSRQELVSAFRQQFVDRSFVTDLFAPGREPGVMVHGGLSEGMFEYALGGFNGDGQNVNTNDDNALRWAARVAVNPLGPVPYSEGDLDRTQEPRIGIGANFFHNPVRAVSPDVDVDAFGFDGVFFLQGLSVQGEWFVRRSDADTGPTATDVGGYLQAGYCLENGWEGAVRLAGASFDDDVLAAGATRQQREYQLAVSRYFRKHDLKLQADVTRRVVDVFGGGDLEDSVLRAQFEVAF